MGLLSSITKSVYKVLDPVLTVIAKPVESVKAIIDPNKTLKEVETEFFSQSKIKQATQFATNVALVGGGALIGASGKAATVAKALIPTTTKGKVIAAVAAPIVAGAVIKEPAQAISAPSKVAGELAQFGSDVSGLIAEPSIEKAKETILESPLIIGAGVAAAAAPLVVAGVKGAIIGESIGDVEEAIRESKPTIVATPQFDTAPIPTTLPSSSNDTAMITSSDMIPILPEDKVKTKRRSYKRKPQVPIRITNRNINKLVAIVR